MKKAKKHISIIFMLAAGIIILAHQVIPHHHNYGFPCHNEHSAEQHFFLSRDTKYNLIHCHAFNELYNEKLTSYNLSRPIPVSNIDLILMSPFVVIFTIYINSEFLNYITFISGDPAIFSLSPLRAPPLTIV